MKWAPRKIYLYFATLLPIAMLSAYLLEFRFPLPGFLLPQRSYYLIAPDAAHANTSHLPRNAYAVSGDSVRRLIPEGNEAFAGMPARPPLATALADSRLHRYSAARIIANGPLSPRQTALAEKHYRETGIPVRFTRLAPQDPGLISALSAEYDTGTGSTRLSVLLEPACASADGIELWIGGKSAYSSSGKALPASRKLSFSLPPGGKESGARIQIRFSDPQRTYDSTLRVASSAETAPKTLLVSSRGGIRSVFEALYPVKKIEPQALALENPFAYELIVVDGVPLAQLPAGAASRLVDYARRGAGSLFFAADSPDFARTGDSPGIERILPVDLSPRSLKNLPDMAMLIVIDVSGSMFGDKLSLAKVTGTETLSNLKPTDIVGMLLFSEQYRWLRRFEPNAGAEPADGLEPVRAGGGTRMLPALMEGIRELVAAPMPVKHIVLITDGITEPGDFSRAIQEASDNNITISSMALGEGYNHELLNAIATGTGGRLYFVKGAQEIPSLILEDRKSVSRTNFVVRDQKVLSMFGADAGTVGGMARFTARKDSVVLFATPEGDPLLASREANARSVFAFSSDIYSHYTKGFFGDENAMTMFKTVMDRQFREKTPSYTVTETRGGITVTMRSDSFVKPSIAFAAPDGTVLEEREMRRAMPSWYAATFSPPEAAEYTALVSDRGAALARFPVYANLALAAPTDADLAADAAYRAPFFALLPGGKIWLALFFLCSLAATVAFRVAR